MGRPLSEAARRLFDATNLVTVATHNPGGEVHLSMVWAKVDGDDIVFSTLSSRRKSANLGRDPRVSLITFDPEEPYHYAEVRGRASVVADPGGSLLQELAAKYTGGDSWPDSAPDRRVIVRVTPDHVFTR